MIILGSLESTYWTSA